MWKQKETLSLKNKLYFRPLAGAALHQAEIIFTETHHSMAEIASVFPLLKPKIIPLGGGVPRNFKKKTINESAPILLKYGIQHRYLLCVSSLEPRKNIPFILDNISDILMKHSLQLVLVGRQAWGQNAITDTIIKNHLESSIIQTGYISDFDLQCLYSNAVAFLYPSLNEGFGLPVVEAFVCECPAIISNIGVLREVAGDAALYCDPRDGASLIQCIERLLADSSLRNRQIDKGRAQSKKYSFTHAAEIFLRSLPESIREHA
jgi:glycosyltransferase involved in cell wall biosynthesis